MNKISPAIAAFSIIASSLALSGAINTADAQSLRSNGWYKACSDQGNNKICNVQYQAVASTGQVVTSVNLATITGELKRRVFQITVPTGRSIPPGIGLQVDGKKATAVPYSFCTPRICAAEVKLDDNLIKILKAGGEMIVASTNFQGKQNPIKVTLSGFTAAFDGPPIKQEELQDRQQKLAEELKKKAEETQKKLQEAQDSATEDDSSTSN